MQSLQLYQKVGDMPPCHQFPIDQSDGDDPTNAAFFRPSDVVFVAGSTLTALNRIATSDTDPLDTAAVLFKGIALDSSIGILDIPGESIIRQTAGVCEFSEDDIYVVSVDDEITSQPNIALGECLDLAYVAPLDTGIAGTYTIPTLTPNNGVSTVNGRRVRQCCVRFVGWHPAEVWGTAKTDRLALVTIEPSRIQGRY